MERHSRIFAIAVAVAIFVALPLAIYAVDDVPLRTLLKESISILTLLSFFLLIGQFFLARSFPAAAEVFRTPVLQRVHRWIGYSVAAVLLLHPFLLVLPRYFEPGVRPIDALWTMLTTFGSVGVVTGLVAWLLLAALGGASYFRMSLIRRLRIRYRTWRYVHAALATGLLAAALWHSIDLGRHSGLVMSTVMLVVAGGGIGHLGRLYISERPKGDHGPEGART